MPNPNYLRGVRFERERLTGNFNDLNFYVRSHSSFLNEEVKAWKLIAAGLIRQIERSGSTARVPEIDLVDNVPEFNTQFDGQSRETIFRIRGKTS